MKTTTIEIPDGKRAEWINGVLTLVDNKPIEYKFKVGDKVTHPKYKNCEIDRCFGKDNEPWYHLKYIGNVKESELEPYITKSITERIKTFEDAFKWCEENGNLFLCSQYKRISEMPLISSDLLAYLKLRIITAALNEGWEPTLETYSRYVPAYSSDGRHYAIEFSLSYYGDSSSKLCFKNRDLALYAANQFKDIYADFCGIKKGGEK